MLSYRHADSAAVARALHGELVRVLGDERVFFDRESIEAGGSFDHEIPRAVQGADVVLALIGPRWEQEFVARAKGHDDVRVELATALARRKRVLPVLLDGAQWPPTGPLPAEVQALVRVNALRLRDSDWRNDVAAMLSTLDVPALKSTADASSGVTISGRSVNIADSHISGGDMVVRPDLEAERARHRWFFRRRD